MSRSCSARDGQDVGTSQTRLGGVALALPDQQRSPPKHAARTYRTRGNLQHAYGRGQRALAEKGLTEREPSEHAIT